MAVNSAQLQQLYLAYFGRPADFSGIEYYTTGNWDIWQVAHAFSESPESQALYGTVFSPSVINAIYNNLFGRDAEPAGLAYWSLQVTSGALTPGEVALAILLGAQNEDATAIANKLAVAETFTAHVDTSQEIAAYAGNWAAGIVRTFFHTVTWDVASVAPAMDKVDPVIASLYATATGGGSSGSGSGGGGGSGGGSGGGGGSSGGDPFTLTIGVDNVAAPSGTSIDTVTGVIDDDGTAHNNTFSDGDVIQGNGQTIMNVTVKNTAGAMPVATVSNIDQLNFINAGGATATFDASGWTNISQVTFGGSSGLHAHFDNWSNGGPITLSFDGGTSGTAEIPWSNASARVGDLLLSGGMHNNSTADAVGASAMVGPAGMDIMLGASDGASWAWGVSAASPAGVTVGDIALDHVTAHAGADSNLDFTLWTYVSATSGSASMGNVDVGQISITAATNAQLYGRIAPAAFAGGGSATIGDIAVAGVDIHASKALAGLNISSSAVSSKGDASVGNVTVGDVSIDTFGQLTFYVANTAKAFTSGSATAGSVAVGEVVIDAQINNFDYFYNRAKAAKGDATVGDLSIASIDAAGNFQDKLLIGNQASVAQTGSASAGNLTIGNIDLTALPSPFGGSIHYALVSMANSAVASGGGTGAAIVGDVSIGDVAMYAASATNTLHIANKAHAAAGGIAIAGTVTVGNIAVAASAGAVHVSIANQATGISTSAGPVSIGNITVADGGPSPDNLGDLAGWFSAKGRSVTVGNVDYSAYTDAAVIDVSGYAGASTIKAGKAGSTIVDNAGTNTIDLTAGAGKADAVYFVNAQSAVGDSGTAGTGGGTVTADASAIDVVMGWDAGDKLSLWDAATSKADAIDGNGSVVVGTASTYAGFLADAETQITRSNNSAYVAVIGGNTYVALNDGGKVAEVVEITGSHNFAWTAGMLEESSAPGSNLTATTGVDNLTATDATSVDTVDATVDQSKTADNGTLNTGDTITGNGNTIVNVVLQDTAGGTPTVTLSDIAQLNFDNVGATTAIFDASGWTSVSDITLGGADGAHLVLDGLAHEDQLTLQIESGTTGSIEIGTPTAIVGGLDLSGSLASNGAADATAAFGTAIDIQVGASASAGFTFGRQDSSLATPVTIGDILLDHINVGAGTAAQVGLTVFQTAMGYTVPATVGNVDVGSVALNLAASAVASIVIANEAFTPCGEDASAGNLSASGISVNVDASATASIEVRNRAGAHALTSVAQTASANVGGVSLGDLNVSGAGSFGLQVFNTADGTSDLTSVGGLTLGNVSLEGAGGAGNESVLLVNRAHGVNGDGSAGDVQIGTVTLDAGQHATLAVTNLAYGSATATAGAVTIGDVGLHASNSATNRFNIANSAQAFTALASVGDVTLGNVAMSAVSGENLLYVQEHAYAWSNADAVIGDFSVGSITTAQPASAGNGDNEFNVFRLAVNTGGDVVVGDVTIGDVAINTSGSTQVNSANRIVVVNEAQGGFVGSAIVGSFTVGDITAQTGVNGDLVLRFDNYASRGSFGSTGLLSVGNVSLSGAQGASLYMRLDNYRTGFGSTGGIEVGDVSVLAGTVSGTAHFEVRDGADLGSVGDISVGDVTVEARNIEFFVWQSGTNTLSVGATSVGDIALTGAGYGIVQSTGPGGPITLGNATLTLADSDSNTGAGADLSLKIQTQSPTPGGDIVAGNITVGTSGVTTQAAMTQPMAAHVTISATNGTVLIGNIAVSGGIDGSKIGYTDNLSTLSAWFKAAGTAVTIGDVDYSGYQGQAIIDVVEYSGAGTIKGAQAGNVIADNAGVNFIDISASVGQTDYIYLNKTQALVTDTGTAGAGGGTVTAVQGFIDVIAGWGVDDAIIIQDGGVARFPDGNGIIVNGSSATFGQFLLDAETQVTQANNSVYSSVIDGNTYVAINCDGKVAEIVEIMGAHTSFTLDTGPLKFGN